MKAASYVAVLAMFVSFHCSQPLAQAESLETPSATRKLCNRILNRDLGECTELYEECVAWCDYFLPEKIDRRGNPEEDGLFRALCLKSCVNDDNECRDEVADDYDECLADAAIVDGEASL